MKRDQIKVGGKYVNKGAGRTIRTVVAIGPEVKGVNEPCWWGLGEKRPVEQVVSYTTTNKQFKKGEHHLFIRSFLAWAGKEVME